MSHTFEVKVDLTTLGLGIQIAGGSDETTPGVYVISVLPDGAAALAGIKDKDQIVLVDGKSVQLLSHDEIVEVLSNLAGRVVPFLVTRPDRSIVIDVDSQQVRETDVDGMAERDRLALARRAFQDGDVGASIAAHELPKENHSGAASEYVKAAVFGGLDGIITTFAVVASVAGADLSIKVVLIMGFSNLVADGVSMGFGEYMSGVAELNHAKIERKREAWELDNHPNGELKEMVDLYLEKGFTQEEAETILPIMARHKEFFLDHMMIMELGIMPPSGDESPFKQGLVMFTAFMIFGFIPLLAYIALEPINFGFSFDPTFMWACILTAIALFVLGAIKSKFEETTWLKSGLWVLFNGGIAAGVAYLVGYIASKIVDIPNCS